MAGVSCAEFSCRIGQPWYWDMHYRYLRRILLKRHVRKGEKEEERKGKEESDAPIHILHHYSSSMRDRIVLCFFSS